MKPAKTILDLRLAAVFAAGTTLAPLAAAQSQADLEFTDNGTYQLWQGSGVATPRPVSGYIVTKGGASQIPVSNNDGDYMFVYNVTTGNIARYQNSDVRDRQRTVLQSDYRLIGHLTVNVTHAGKPASGVRVSLTGSEPRPAILVGPEDKGQAQFWALGPGSYRVEAKYYAKGDEQTASSDVNLTLDRKDPEPTVNLDLPAAPEPPPIAASTGKPEESKSGSFLPGLLVALVAVLAAIGYWVARKK